MFAGHKSNCQRCNSTLMRGNYLQFLFCFILLLQIRYFRQTECNQPVGLQTPKTPSPSQSFVNHVHHLASPTKKPNPLHVQMADKHCKHSLLEPSCQSATDPRPHCLGFALPIGSINGQTTSSHGPPCSCSPPFFCLMSGFCQTPPSERRETCPTSLSHSA